MPKYFDSGMGRTFERELQNIDKVKNKNCLYILGGNKPKDLMLLIKKKKIIATGVFGILCNIMGGTFKINTLKIFKEFSERLAERALQQRLHRLPVRPREDGRTQRSHRHSGPPPRSGGSRSARTAPPPGGC